MKKKFVTLNIGNSNLTLATNFDQTLIQNSDNIAQKLQNFFTAHPDTYFTYCCVISPNQLQTRYPEINKVILEFKNKSPSQVLDFLPHKKNNLFFKMPTRYAQTLGTDRLTQSYLLWKNLQQTSQNYGLVLDAGTMTTVDLVHREQGHLGGYIFPGLKTYSEIFTVSEQLPISESLLKELKNPFQNLAFDALPLTTLDALSAGYWKSFTLLLLNLNEKHPLEQFVISGGHSSYWYNHLTKLSPCKIENNPLFPHQALWQIGADMLE